MGTLTDPLDVLVSLHRGYGMGDAVQVSAVLRHVRKYRPHWRTDFVAQEGQQCVGAGHVRSVRAYGDLRETPHYDAEVQVVLFDTWANWHDRPNTRVSSCLHDLFGIAWDAECGRYHIAVSEDAREGARGLLASITRGGGSDSGRVAVHYRGDSSPERKNLTHAQAAAVCRAVEHCGRTPVLLDWRDQSPVPDACAVPTVGRFVFSKQWGGNAEINCAVIGQCEAFVGIDSGPSKCASATDTPALVVWTGHHPAPFHDPAPNTTHLVPEGYHGLYPVCDDPGVVAWFEAHHRVRIYKGDPCKEVESWLKEVLV